MVGTCSGYSPAPKRNVLADIPEKDLREMLAAARKRLERPGLISLDVIRDDVAALERELASRSVPIGDKRDPRIPEHFYPAEVVAAARAGHEQYSLNVRDPLPWEQLPIQTQDDWVLIWSRMHRAYIEAGGAG